MQVLQQQNLFIYEQKTNEPNPLYDLANITKHVDTNSDAVHTYRASVTVASIYR
jgi:hypothetical protein